METRVLTTRRQTRRHPAPPARERKAGGRETSRERPKPCRVLRLDPRVLVSAGTVTTVEESSPPRPTARADTKSGGDCLPAAGGPRLTLLVPVLHEEERALARGRSEAEPRTSAPYRDVPTAGAVRMRRRPFGSLVIRRCRGSCATGANSGRPGAAEATPGSARSGTWPRPDSNRHLTKRSPLGPEGLPG